MLQDFILHGWHLWILLGIALLALEIATTSFAMGGIALGAFAAAGASYYGATLTQELLVLAAATVAAMLFVRPFVKRFLASPEGDLPQGQQLLLGQTATVVEPIDASRNTGRIRIAGSIYQARAATPEAPPLPAGALVTVKAFDNLTALVEGNPPA